MAIIIDRIIDQNDPSSNSPRNFTVQPRDPLFSDGNVNDYLWINSVDNTYFILSEINEEGSVWVKQGLTPNALAQTSIREEISKFSEEGNADSSVKGSATIAGISILVGEGSPDGIVSSACGSLFIRTDARDASMRMYINNDGAFSWSNFIASA